MNTGLQGETLSDAGLREFPRSPSSAPESADQGTGILPQRPPGCKGTERGGAGPCETD